MDLRKVRSFVALAESGSLQRTAQQRYLTPPAVYRQIRSLEESVGLELYERAGNALRLTAAGRHLLPHLKRLLAQEEAVRAIVEEWKGVRGGTVRVGAGPTFAANVLPPLLHAFRAAHRGVEVVFTTGSTRQLVQAIDQGDLDLVFMTSRLLPGGPALEILCAWEYEIVLASHRSRGLPETVSLRELEDLPFILYAETSMLDTLIREHFAEHGFTPRVEMRLDSAETAKAFVQSGFGVSMLPSWMFGGSEAGELAMHRTREAPLLPAVGLAICGQSGGVPAVERFAGYAVEWEGWAGQMRPRG